MAMSLTELNETPAGQSGILCFGQLPPDLIFDGVPLLPSKLQGLFTAAGDSVTDIYDQIMSNLLRGSQVANLESMPSSSSNACP
jgi:hypothetical protein